MLKGILKLRNMEVLSKAVVDAQNAPIFLPKMVTFHGPSGYGKSFAAALVANKFKCFYVEIGASWSLSTLLDNILKEIGTVLPCLSIAKKVEEVISGLRAARRPLIIDEFDKITKERGLEIIREIHDKANVPLILIGEEMLPKKLEVVERFHNRVLNWVKAEPVSLPDACKLAQLYCPKVTIGEDLLQKLVAQSQGRVRRVCVNLANINVEANLQGWQTVNLAVWGKQEIFAGIAPRPRII